MCRKNVLRNLLLSNKRRVGTLNVASHISVAHGLIYTLSNYMHHERAKQNYHKSPEISCTTVLLYFMAQRRGAWSHVPHLLANQNAGIWGQQVQRGIKPQILLFVMTPTAEFSPVLCTYVNISLVNMWQSLSCQKKNSSITHQSFWYDYNVDLKASFVAQCLRFSISRSVYNVSRTWHR